MFYAIFFGRQSFLKKMEEALFELDLKKGFVLDQDSELNWS